jgi:hypothetical protein
MATKILLICCLCALAIHLPAQVASLSSNRKQLIFSAIKQTESKPDTLTLTLGKGTAKIKTSIVGDQSAKFKILSKLPSQIAANQKVKLALVFAPADLIGIAKANLRVTDLSGKELAKVNLTGLGLKGVEGENEAALTTVMEALGYNVNVGWRTLAHHAKPALQGDEIAATSFKKTGKGRVEMIPVARFSPDFELPFGYYTTSAGELQKHQAGILSKTVSKPQHAALFPAMSAGGTSFDPGENVFGLYATGPTHSGYTADAWNLLLHPANVAHAVRTYPAKDQQGKHLKDSYIVCFEEAKNGDYNDYVFLVKNVMPVADGKDFTSLFNGKDLEGWDIFLTGKGLNNDPAKNFAFQNDGVLYVTGKELGYIRTKKGFSNYHFSVEFKWGEKNWPPRVGAKKDAGICYNIPMNEPDSIWPQSIECQIQEGDTGDFWLLGFSTIAVNDSTNKPTNHTRMQKKLDAEKPNGEWNTVEVISYNGTCIHIVNGVEVNRGEKASTKDGCILLQSEYSEVYYRNAKIKQL